MMSSVYSNGLHSHQINPTEHLWDPVDKSPAMYDHVMPTPSKISEECFLDIVEYMQQRIKAAWR